MIEPITKRTFKGDSNSREWQLMEKLAEVTAELNRLTQYVDGLQAGAEALLRKQGLS